MIELNARDSIWAEQAIANDGTFGESVDDLVHAAYAGNRVAQRLVGILGGLAAASGRLDNELHGIEKALAEVVAGRFDDMRALATAQGAAGAAIAKVEAIRTRFETVLEEFSDN